MVTVVITGLILGGIYALVAVGLNLQYGVGRVLNVAHGEFIMLGAFITYSLFVELNISPLVSIIIIVPTLFIMLSIMLFSSISERHLPQPMRSLRVPCWHRLASFSSFKISCYSSGDPT
jgi:branched-subunit amino acid ABC-type transport system permease component